jgi:hypothetical protein
VSQRGSHPQRDEIDRIAKILIDAWARAEPDHGVTLHPVSYAATFVDMARAVVEDRAASPQPRCSCSYEAGDSKCEAHPTCLLCGAMGPSELPCPGCRSA